MCPARTAAISATHADRGSPAPCIAFRSILRADAWIAQTGRSMPPTGPWAPATGAWVVNCPTMDDSDRRVDAANPAPDAGSPRLSIAMPDDGRRESEREPPEARAQSLAALVPSAPRQADARIRGPRKWIFRSSRHVRRVQIACSVTSTACITTVRRSIRSAQTTRLSLALYLHFLLFLLFLLFLALHPLAAVAPREQARWQSCSVKAAAETCLDPVVRQTRLPAQQRLPLLRLLPPHQTDLVVSLEVYVVSLGENLQRKELKLCVAFNRLTNFPTVAPQKNRLLRAVHDVSGRNSLEGQLESTLSLACAEPDHQYLLGPKCARLAVGRGTEASFILIGVDVLKTSLSRPTNPSE
jgi:hypothetical protein